MSLLDLTKRPAPQPPPELHLPAIEKHTLSNGLSVWLVEKHTLPSIAFNLIVNAGTDRDPSALPGLASITAEMMESGSATMTALTIADRLDFIGAVMSIRAGLDATSAFLHTLTKHLDEALTVFGEVVSSPTFPEEELERTRSQRLTSLLQQRDRASYVANVAFNRIVYGAHPYGNDPSGTEESLRSIRREDLTLFYNSFYRPEASTLIVVGDVRGAELLPRLETALAGWQHGVHSADDLPPVPPPDKRKVFLVDKPGASQSEIRIGRPGLPRSTPDYFPLIVMNRILGGQFSSRINLNLRERNGYTYGAGSYFRFARKEGPFVVSGGFISAKTDRAIAELITEISQVHAEGLTVEEIEFSKKGISGSFALTFETPMQIATALQSIALYGLPDNYYNEYVKNVGQVTREDVKRVARLYLDVSAMAVVVVGDVKEIRPGIEQLNLGEIVLCNSTGTPLTASMTNT